MKLPLSYLDAASIQEVPIDLWKDVFDVVGWPSSLLGKRESFGHADVLRAFEHDDPTDGLLQALETLESLGTEAGREAIMSAIRDRGVPSNSLPTGQGEKEFALRFYIAQRTNASLADVFIRAQIQVQEGGNQRRYNEFIGKEARRINDLDRVKDALREEILLFSGQLDLGEHVQVEAFEDDGIYIFNILRSHRTQKPLAVVPGHLARATIQFRPIHGDVIRYDAIVGRLRIAARASSVIDLYQEVLGKTLFNDPSFFDGNAVCSLSVLQERGRDALENHGVFGIGRVWMTECLWERGDRDLHQIRSTDCFRSMEELNLPMTQGTLLQAKLKCEVVGKSTRPITVNIRVPSRIEVSKKAHEQVIDKLLNVIGIRNSAPASSVANIWALYPWRHPVDVWRSLFRAETDKLVRDRILMPIQLSSVQHPDHPQAGRTLDAHAVSDGDFYGVSRVPEIPPRSLTATDLDGLELAPEQLRLYLRLSLGISNGGAVWDQGELLELGFIEVGDKRIYAVYLLRCPTTGIGDSLRARAGGAPLVLLIPSSESESSELANVRLESALPKRSVLIRDAIHACGLSTSVPAIHVAPDGARLVVDTVLGKIWVDSVEITGLAASSQPFQMIELLARSSPRCVSANDIVDKLSPGRQDGNTAARQAKTAARRTIAEAMTAIGRPFDEDPFPSAGNGSYRCALPSYVH